MHAWVGVWKKIAGALCILNYIVCSTNVAYMHMYTAISMCSEILATKVYNPDCMSS